MPHPTRLRTTSSKWHPTQTPTHDRPKNEDHQPQTTTTAHRRTLTTTSQNWPAPSTWLTNESRKQQAEVSAHLSPTIHFSNKVFRFHIAVSDVATKWQMTMNICHSTLCILWHHGKYPCPPNPSTTHLWHKRQAMQPPMMHEWQRHRKMTNEEQTNEGQQWWTMSRGEQCDFPPPLPFLTQEAGATWQRTTDEWWQLTNNSEHPQMETGDNELRWPRSPPLTMDLFNMDSRCHIANSNVATRWQLGTVMDTPGYYPYPIHGFSHPRIR